MVCLSQEYYHKFGIKTFWLDNSEPWRPPADALFGRPGASGSSGLSWADAGALFDVEWPKLFHDGLKSTGDTPGMLLPRASWVRGRACPSAFRCLSSNQPGQSGPSKEHTGPPCFQPPQPSRCLKSTHGPLFRLCRSAAGSTGPAYGMATLAQHYPSLRTRSRRCSQVHRSIITMFSVTMIVCLQCLKIAIFIMFLATETTL